jgi:hypothetical protein
VQAIQDQIADPEHIAYVLRRVEDEIAKLRSDLPDTLKLKEAELNAEQRRLANLVDFIGEGRGSLELVTPDIGRPFYRAVTTLDALALIEEPPPAGAEGGSNSLQRWDSFQMPRDGRSRHVQQNVCTATRCLVYIVTATDGRASTPTSREGPSVCSASRYLPLGRGTGGIDPPRPSSIPILMVGVLIWSGGTGRGAIGADSIEEPQARRGFAGP